MSEKEDFYKSVYKIAVPVTLQSLLMALLNLTDQLMVGQLGDVAIASVGMSTKIYGIIAVVLAVYRRVYPYMQPSFGEIKIPKVSLKYWVSD